MSRLSIRAWWSLAVLLALIATLKAAEPKETAAQKKAAAKADLLARFDANGNGRLDQDERKAAAAERAKQRKNRKQDAKQAAAQAVPIPPPAAAANAAGSIGPPARGTSQAKLLAKFDRNRNGRLDGPEIQAANAAMKNAKKGQAGAAPNRGGKLSEKLDTDGDGRVEPSEAAAARSRK
ncbi:MAG: hypothetical protein WD278_12075 [Pirellulales bacterium]